MVPARARPARTLISSAVSAAGSAGLSPGRATPASEGRRSGRAGGAAGVRAVMALPPRGDAPAGQHAQAERERLSARVQGSMTQLLIAGVQPAAGNAILAGIRAGARFSSRAAR